MDCGPEIDQHPFAEEEHGARSVQLMEEHISLGVELLVHCLHADVRHGHGAAPSQDLEEWVAAALREELLLEPGAQGGRQKGHELDLALLHPRLLPRDCNLE